MTMDRPSSQEGRSSSASSEGGSSSGGGVGGATGTLKPVVSIECLKGTSKADEWTRDMLQTGDILEEIKIGRRSVQAPFKNGKAGVQKILRESFKNKETSVLVRVRRSGEYAELQACIVPNAESGSGSGKRQYMLRAIADPNYAVGFSDRTEAGCFALQASRGSRMVSALSRTKLQDGYVPYAWERKMQEVLPVTNSSSFISILFLPKVSDREASRYNDLEDTLARANTWLNASQASGVSIVFMNVQTESLLTKISGDTASSTVNAGSLSDLSNLANVSLYGFEDYHGVDIGVVRAVRLWYSPLVGEMPIEIKLRDDDTKLGFAISRTEEGFIFISSVIEDDETAPSTRSGLSTLYREATSSGRLLVVSRLSNQKILPWMVSSTGAIRCFDTISLSQKLSLHRHAKVPILIHIVLWDHTVWMPGSSSSSPSSSARNSFSIRIPPPSVMPLPTQLPQASLPNANQVQPLPFGVVDVDGGSQTRMERDTAGEVSFRFRDFSFSNNNWV